MNQSRRAREGQFQTRRGGRTYRGFTPIGPWDLSCAPNRTARKRLRRAYPDEVRNARQTGAAHWDVVGYLD